MSASAIESRDIAVRVDLMATDGIKTDADNQLQHIETKDHTVVIHYPGKHSVVSGQKDHSVVIYTILANIQVSTMSLTYIRIICLSTSLATFNG